MSALFEMCKQITQAHAAPILADELQNARLRNGQLNHRIHELETVLNRMVLTYENTLSESQGHFPVKDAGCPDCTSGTVPDNRNTGRCAYHEAKVLLGQI